MESDNHIEQDHEDEEKIGAVYSLDEAIGTEITAIFGDTMQEPRNIDLNENDTLQ